MLRQTRTGKQFSPWSGILPISTCPSFDYEELLRASIEREDCLDIGDDAIVPVIMHQEVPPERLNRGEISTSATSSRQREFEATAPSPPPDPGAAGVGSDADDSDHNESASQKRKRRNREKKHALRAKKRRLENSESFSRHKALPSFERKYKSVAVPVVCAEVLSGARVVRTGYTAKRDAGVDTQQYSVEDLTGEGSEFNFEYVSWDASTTVPIVSPSGVVIAVLAGHPMHPDWSRVADEAAKLLESVRARCEVTPDEMIHRRGAFVALQSGVSHGGGQEEPSNLSSGMARFSDVTNELNASEPFIRISGFTNSVMSSWAPDLYSYYSKTMHALHDHDPRLVRIFPSSVFAAASYNLGPQTACFRHTDFANLPFGWCAVTALGDFDPTRGGHLVLWDCRLVIEFPPGATILLPSATVAHSNTSIGPEETRYSFAQYTAGALFRWVENGFRPAEKVEKSMTKKQKAEKIVRDAARYKLGLSLLPTMTKPTADKVEAV